MLLCKLEKKFPGKKFSNNLDSNNFETKQSEKIQNILPFSLRKQILESEVETFRREGEKRGRFVTKLSNCFIDKTQELSTIKMNKKLLLILLSKSFPLLANKISQLRKQNRRKAFIYGVL